jgi:hypothetical protein
LGGQHGDKCRATIAICVLRGTSGPCGQMTGEERMRIMTG